MNRYVFDDIYVGMEESFSVSITEKMMEQFLAITGDTNPLHNNGTYACESGYKDRVVYGMLTASFLSTLAGVYMPGEHSLIQSVEIKMVKPVFIGDKLLVKGLVTEKSESVPVIILKIMINNQDNNVIMRGKMQIGVKK